MFGKKNQKKPVQSNKIESSILEVRFLQSPTGAFHLAYSKGDVATLDKKLAEELIAAKYAEAVKK